MQREKSGYIRFETFILGQFRADGHAPRPIVSPDFTVRTVSPEHFLWSKVPHELQRVPI